MKENKTNPGDRLFGLRINLLTKNSNVFINVIGSLLMNFKLVVSEKIETACINIKTKTIFFGTDFMSKLTDEQLKGLIMHEVMHYMLAHDFLLTLDKYAFAIMNLAQDIKINHYLLKMKIPLPKEGVLPDVNSDTYALEGTDIVIRNISQKTSEQIYKEIMDEAKKMNNGMLESLLQNSDVIFVDDDEETDNKGNAVSRGLDNIKSEIISEAETIVKNAIEKTASKDSLSKEIDLKLIPDNILKTLGWYKQFFNKLKNKLTNKVYRIYKQKISYPKKRLYEKGIYVNKSINKGYLVNIFVDTSGSMTESDIKECTRHIFPLCKHAIVSFRCFDTEIYDEIKIKNYNDIDKIKIKGRGGTHINKVLNMCEDIAKSHRCVNILYSDLEDDINPHKTKYIDLVITTKEHNADNVKLFKNTYNYDE